jgi:CO/xanthine dehydrogenase Mo-binding subunit
VEISEVLSDINGILGPIMGRGFFARAGGRIFRQWSAAVAEVEVDVDTGEVQLMDMDHVMATGRTIWYKGAYNQSIGGVEQTLGRILFEGMVKDMNTGITLNGNYLDYKIPTIMDSPNMNIDFHEHIANYGPLGAVGIGEPIVGAPGIAILNAIYNACGARIYAPPATPEKILAALGKA